FNNFAIDCLMLYLSLLTLKRKIKLWRLFLSSIIGAVYALFSPLISFTGDIVIKIIMAILMCLIVVKILSIKKLALLIATFLIYSFAFGGIIIGIMNMWQPFRETMSNPSNMNIGLMCTIFIITLAFCRKTLQLIQKKRISEGNVKKVIINENKKIIREQAYYDSGNTLYYKGIYPVIVMDESLKFDGNAVGSINIDTICGAKNTDVFKLEKIVVDNRIYDSVYCVFNKLGGSYKILLHNDTY
ncbi:MAG: sigma-E processing peptidase SpoIIGA, partial [Clostridia bacterium]|nr:sigma-E processing peptidase SpoIIGA [Clostridia bacterium]